MYRFWHPYLVPDRVLGLTDLLTLSPADPDNGSVWPDVEEQPFTGPSMWRS
jgi:hypothetical protein